MVRRWKRKLSQLREPVVQVAAVRKPALKKELLKQLLMQKQQKLQRLLRKQHRKKQKHQRKTSQLLNKRFCNYTGSSTLKGAAFLFTAPGRKDGLRVLASSR